MAEEQDKSDKTEDPTHKRLSDAHEKGDVAKSQEVNTWFILFAATVAIGLAGPPAATDLAVWMKEVLAQAGRIPVDAGGLRALFEEAGLAIAVAVLLPLAILVAAGIGGNLVQHAPVLSLDPIKPKASKISPMAGFKRLFSPESLVNFAKGLIKLTLVAALMVMILMPEIDRLDTLVATDIGALLPTTHALALKLMAGVVAFLAVVAVADFLWQRQRWTQRQRMSVREVREEYKQTEGDPAIKMKLRELRMSRGRRRMMARVPEASVVVTNPTHYAVALKYEAGMAAPICIAKGADTVALRIRTAAKEAGVPLVENPPLARSLYAQVDLDQTIPEEHYRAVAEVIGYVMRMRRGGVARANR